MIEHLFSLDFLSAALAIVSTIGFMLAWIGAWPLCLLAVIVDFVIYARLHFYGDAALQIGYFAMSIYGWWAWYRPQQKAGLPMTWLTNLQRLQIMTAIAVLTPIFAMFLQHYHARAPILDALTTLMSVTAQALLTRKKLDNWILWFVIDALYAVMYFEKGIPYHLAILPVYMTMAMVALYRWHQLRLKQLNPILLNSSSSTGAK